MNALKITLILIGMTAVSYSFSQTAEQDFSHLDKNKDGKIDKTEFEKAPPPPPPAPKKPSSEGASRSAEKAKPAPGESAPPPPTPLSFESIDKNKDGVIDMEEFELNHTAIRKRPGSTVKNKN